ncbi:hypothetical protein ACLOJK_034748 [Asimina triloba]
MAAQDPTASNHHIPASSTSRGQQISVTRHSDQLDMSEQHLVAHLGSGYIFDQKTHHAQITVSRHQHPNQARQRPWHPRTAISSAHPIDPISATTATHQQLQSICNGGPPT